MANVERQEVALRFGVVHKPLHAPTTSRGELESKRLELAGTSGSCRTHCLSSGAVATSGGVPLVTAQRKGPVSGAFPVAGAGFEPATSGL